MKKLIRREILPIADDYDHLFSMCHTARYVNYNLGNRFSDSAKKSLAIIKNSCCPPENANKTN